MTRTARILLVEDEFLLGMQIEALLTGAGWGVIGPAGTLASAMKLARSAACDCAVLDINLRGVRIDEAAAILAGRSIPFLFITGYGRDAVPPAYRDNAVVIAKPINERRLLQALRSLVPQVLD